MNETALSKLGYKEVQENLKMHIASKIIFVFQTIMIILMVICGTIGYVQRGDLFLYLFGFVVPILILLIIAVQQLNEIYKYSFCYKELMKQISQDENEVQIEENIQNIN